MKKNLPQGFLETINREFLKCAACGECRTVCPVYAESGLEKNVARGRMALAKALADGDLELTETIQESFENCLLCMACASQCAGHVDMISVVLKTRDYVRSQKGLPRIKAAAFKALAADRKYQDMGAAAGRVAQSLFMSSLPDNSGLRLKLSLPQLSDFRERHLPALAKTPFIGRQDKVYGAKKEKHRVFLFVGCAANYIYTGVAKKTVELLNALDVSVVVLSGQGCCGAPVQAHADTKTLKTLAANNVRVFSQQSQIPIITICSSGGVMLKKDYPGILSQTRVEARALDISQRTMDISEYLVDTLGLKEIQSRIKQKIPQTLTYHDPCHLGRGQQVTRQPRALLQAVCDTYEEMPDAGRCCGLGGTYGLGHADISEQILDKKIKTIESMTPVPSHLATGCPGCIMQLTHGLYKNKLEIEVHHLVHYLWQALGIEIDHHPGPQR